MAKTDPAMQAMIDAAMKAGKVTKVATGASNGMSARDWYKAARDQEVVRVIEDYDIDAEQREEIAREAFGAARLNGASINDAMDDYNAVKRYR